MSAESIFNDTDWSDWTDWTDWTDDDMAEELIISEKSFVEIILLLVISVIFVVGIPANLVVCIITNQRRKTGSIINLFLLNLAVADIVVILKLSLITFSDEIFKTWIFGNSFCHFLIYILGLCKFFETIMLVTSFLLFFFFQNITSRESIMVIALSWFAAGVAAIPRGFHAAVVSGFYGEENCTMDYDHHALHRSVTMITRSLLPAAVIAVYVCCVLIRKYVRPRILDNVKVNKILLATLITYFLLSAPYSTIRTLLDSEYEFISVFHHSVVIITLFASYFTLIYKPFLYIYLDSDFRNDFIKLARRVVRRSDVNYVREMDEEN